MHDRVVVVLCHEPLCSMRQGVFWCVQDLEQLLHAHGISSVGPHQVQ
jgi:hypothetical protein